MIVPLGASWPVYDEALRSTWVGDEMQLMRDAAQAGTSTEIARTADTSQAFVLGPAMALQFHPEVDADLLEAWLADHQGGEASAACLTKHELLTRTAELAGRSGARVRRLVSGFLTYVSG